MSVASPAGMSLLVATDLDSYPSPDPQVFADDVVISGRAYRRLDPAYYAWLRGCMVAVKHQADGGRVARDSFEALRARFEAIHEFAIGQFGEDALRAAVAAHGTTRYEPPRVDPHEFPGGAA